MERNENQYLEIIEASYKRILDRLVDYGIEPTISPDEDQILILACTRNYDVVQFMRDNEEDLHGTERIMDYIRMHYLGNAFSLDTLMKTRQDAHALRRALSSEASMKGVPEHDYAPIVACWKLEGNLAKNLIVRLKTGRRG